MEREKPAPLSKIPGFAPVSGTVLRLQKITLWLGTLDPYHTRKYSYKRGR